MSNDSILIVARNAASTIDRAMRSVFRQGNYPIVLMGDDSSDDTVARPKAMGMERLRVVTVAAHSQLGAARQLGLESIDTEFFDDTWIPVLLQMIPLDLLAIHIKSRARGSSLR